MSFSNQKFHLHKLQRLELKKLFSPKNVICIIFSMLSDFFALNKNENEKNLSPCLPRKTHSNSILTNCIFIWDQFFDKITFFSLPFASTASSGSSFFPCCVCIFIYHFCRCFISSRPLLLMLYDIELTGEKHFIVFSLTLLTQPSKPNPPLHAKLCRVQNMQFFRVISSFFHFCLLDMTASVDKKMSNI